MLGRGHGIGWIRCCSRHAAEPPTRRVVRPSRARRQRAKARLLCFAPALRVTAALAPRPGRLATAPGSGRPTSSGLFSETVGVDFFVEIFLLGKRIHARVLSGDPFRPPDCGVDACFATTAFRSRQRVAHRRTLARLQLRDRASRARRREAYPLPAMAGRRSRGEGIGVAAAWKFSALQSLENS